MNRGTATTSALVTWLLLTTAGCATTQLKSVWKDEAFQDQLAQVLVIGCAEQPTIRRTFEDEFCKQLRAQGVEAVASYTVLPSTEQFQDEEAVKAKVQKLGVDAVLVTRLIDRKTVELYYPPEMEYRVPSGYHRGGWHGYYMDSYERVSRPGRTVEQQLLTAETNIYEADTEKLIWSALSETLVEGASDTVIRSFVKVIVQNLVAKGLI
jgi:hypothetical protein